MKDWASDEGQPAGFATPRDGSLIYTIPWYLIDHTVSHIPDRERRANHGSTQKEKCARRWQNDGQAHEEEEEERGTKQ